MYVSKKGVWEWVSKWVVSKKGVGEWVCQGEYVSVLCLASCFRVCVGADVGRGSIV